jgi:hypothetical protein
MLSSLVLTPSLTHILLGQQSISQDINIIGGFDERKEQTFKHGPQLPEPADTTTAYVIGQMACNS